MSYPVPKPFVVVAGNRTGATFLCHCLSNHPQVFCHRGETMHQGDVWRRSFPRMSPERLLDAMLHQTGYVASGCKLLQEQLLSPKVLGYVTKHQVPILFLVRRSLLSQAVSLWIVRNKVLGHPLHTTKVQAKNLSKTLIEPSELLLYCKGLVAIEEAAGRQVKQLGLPVLHLTYEEIVGPKSSTKVPVEVGKRICAFLEVKVRRLSSSVRKVHSADLGEVLTNYEEIRRVFLESEFASRLE